ncbi:MAG: HAMP domain-containing histidine kinase [Elusimicrobia bacterium]|nr:HAMP domain-containing histidine kinase [Elusimicrobiota bacterium]
MIKRNVNFNSTTFFPKNTYEIVFSVFMVAIAYLSRYSEQVVYPRILYFFLFLMFSNLVFNGLISKYRGVKIGYLNLLVLLNIVLITGILINSGSANSYFWVLFLLPLFTVALIVDLLEISLVLLLISVILAYFHSTCDADIVGWAGYFVKTLVLVMSSAVIYRTAMANKKLEAEIIFKRGQVDNLSMEIKVKNSEIVQAESMVEMGKVISGLVHDLGNVMTVILLASEIAQQSDDYSKKDIGKIIKAATLGKGMLANVMQVVRNENYKFEMADIKEPIERGLDVLSYQAREKNIIINSSFQEKLPLIKISKIHIERIILNTVLNAISLMAKEGVIEIKVYTEDSCVILKIKDEGPGFPEELLKKGINAFGTDRKDKGGTGLGLFVCDQIMRKHGGSMSISNGLDKGSVLEFRFPVKNADDSKNKKKELLI